MNNLSTAPRTLRGALVVFDLPDPTPKVIVFQYNPATLTRTLEMQLADAEGKSADGFRLKGAPNETLKLEVEIDAADQVQPDDDAGILPHLAALEILLYPKSGSVTLNNALLKVGTIEIIPATAPFTLFIWGKRRILPVRITEFSVTEDAHHPNLSPIRAKVSLGLRVVTYSDVTSENPAWNLFLAHQVLKETMAALATTNSLTHVLGGQPPLL
jgi:hypothetical protein